MRIVKIVCGTILISSGILTIVAGGEQTNSALAELITKEAVALEDENIPAPVTVDRELYLIFAMKNRIDPVTCRVVPGSGVAKLYVDSKNCPVSNSGTAQKIGIIDYVRRLQKNELTLDRLKQETDALTEKKKVLAAIQFGEDSVRILKDFPTTIRLGSLIDKVGWKTAGIFLKKMAELNQELSNNLDKAVDNYVYIMREVRRSRYVIEDYTKAHAVLEQYLMAKSYSRRYSFLYGMIYGRYVEDNGLLTWVSEKTLRILTHDISEELLAKIIQEDYKKFCEKERDDLNQQLSKQYEATEYTLQLAQSGKSIEAPIQSVQKLGDEKLLNSLIEKLKDQDPRVREKAAKTLGEIKDPRAVEPLIDAMRGKLPYSGANKYVVQALVAGEYSYVREAAAEALGEIRDPRAVEPLIDALKDINYKFREVAARVLGKIKDPRAVEPLIFAVKNDEYESVRCEAIWALGEIRDPRAVDLLIAVLKGEINAPDSFGDIDDYAAIALRTIGEPAVKPLISAYKSALKENDSSVRLLSEQALKKMKDQRTVEPLIAALKDEEWHVREIAVAVLGAFNDHRAIEALIDALADEHPIVRSSVREALVRITGEHFGNDQMKWKKWWESNLKETPQAQMDKVPMWVFEPLTHTSTPYSPRYPRRLIFPVSEINTASRDLVYLIEAKENNLKIRGKTDQLVFSRSLIITEMESGLKTQLETLRPDVAEELKSNLAKIVKQIEEIIYLAKAPGFQNNLEKIRSIQSQINETSQKIIDILE